MRKITWSFPLLLLVLTLFFSPNRASAAYVDYSYHRVITGNFVGEESVNNALQRLTSDTGWWANYESTGNVVPYYRVYSGDYYNEEIVKNKVFQFQSSTGINASYQPIGELKPYSKIITGYFYGEENVRRIIQDFTNKTGFSASYEQTGDYVNKKRLISGGIGEENAKKIVQQLQEATGIPSTYESTGEYQQYAQIITGEFYDDSVIKTVQDFMKNTGINASYKPIEFSEGNLIATGWFVGEANVQSIVTQIKNDLGLSAKYEPVESNNAFKIIFDPLAGNSLLKATTYLDQKGWWYNKTLTGKMIPTTFRIISEATQDKQKLNLALSYFNNRNLWATSNPTGQKGDELFRIISNSLTENLINKGISYFNQNGLECTTQTTDEKDFSFYRIITEPILGTDRVGDFFKKNGWWYSTQPIDKLGYSSFRIVTQALLGTEKSEKAINFFNSNGLWATSESTGASENEYKIVTGYFRGYENTLANAQMIRDRYGWWVTTEKILNGPLMMTTNYNMTLNEMINLQMTQTPQTDEYRYDPAYIYSAYVDVANHRITENKVNVRNGPSTDNGIVAQLNKDFTGFKVLGNEGAWVKIDLTWKNASRDDVAYYLDPNNFPADSNQYFQFLKLSKPADINIDEVNEKILNSNVGSLRGTAGAFVQAAQLYNINEIYLISHALHETGNGTSALAKGVLYNGKVVYNMYGYGAYDDCAVNCGAQKAYEQGWFTPELAIIGGANLIGSNYIYNTTFQQDTLYKMRWNPVASYHQYATDIGWAAKQVTNVYNIYQLLNNYTLFIDLPSYQ
jgi:beta-N-acetylglucosaminidase